MIFKKIKKKIRVKYFKVKMQIHWAIKYHTYHGNWKQFIWQLIFD